MQSPCVRCSRPLGGVVRACWRPCVVGAVTRQSLASAPSIPRQPRAAACRQPRPRGLSIAAMAGETAQAAPAAKRPAWVSLPIILGSESASRRGIMDELAEQFGFSYTTVAANIDEKAIRNSDPAALVLSLAHAKAMAIGVRWQEEDMLPSEGLLITCDQIVLCNGEVLEKPETEEQARHYIRGYSDGSAHTVGAIRVTHIASGRSVAATDMCEVHFDAIPDSTVDALAAEKATYSCAGGLMVEHPLVSPLIAAQYGTKDALMGLSKELLLELLHKAAMFKAPPSPEELAAAARAAARAEEEMRFHR